MSAFQPLRSLPVRFDAAVGLDRMCPATYKRVSNRLAEETDVDREALVILTADIVSSHVANNSVSIGNVGNVVQAVHAALAGLEKPAGPEAEARQPAVSVRSSVKPEAIACLVCGQKQKTLKRHLSSAHGLTPTEYRAEFGLPASYPMVAPAYSARRSEIAKRIGLGRKKSAKRKVGAKPKAKAVAASAD